MKCDELKPLVFSLNDLAYIDESAVKKNFENPHDHAVYKATEVDAAIAELKQKLMPCLNGDCILTCEVVEKYGKENAELKQKLEDAKATHYAEMVDAGMRERRLRRALWLARALRARDIQMWWLAVTCAPITERACRVWHNVESKCRAKAEQYK